MNGFINNFERILFNYDRFCRFLAVYQSRTSKVIQRISFLLTAIIIALPAVILMYSASRFYMALIAFISVTTGYFFIALLHPKVFQSVSKAYRYTSVNYPRLYSVCKRLIGENGVLPIDLDWHEEVMGRRIKNIEESKKLCDLARRTVSALAERFNPENAAVFMHDLTMKCFKITSGFGYSDWEFEFLKLQNDSPLIKKFQKEKIMLVKSQLEKTFDPIECIELKKEMDRIRGEVSVPLTLEDGTLYAVISIGPKKSVGPGIADFKDTD